MENDKRPETAAEKPRLVLLERGLVLTDGKLELTADFTGMLRRIRRGNLQNEMLVKAVRIRGSGEVLSVLDATAGLGEDSLLLAAAGFRVTLYEYDPMIAALLRDSLTRASELAELREIVSRMTFFEGDSIPAMRKLSTRPEGRPDVILLDPMFPRRQKSAMIGKKFQLLQQLEQPCTDEKELLGAAIAAEPKKIVIKRPVKGPYLAGMKPDYSLTGKAIRCDCMINLKSRTVR